ncbi:hypothetical protein [uncultured Tenacibaculum sp.]|uniref:hypothetical protein n=1 Tax=uncultured Tenacibaculum sp. TaxID=174713 RepID=UPI002622A06E|nr:hypothetical protein [uncultured Tenacibaculum sp.]
MAKILVPKQVFPGFKIISKLSDDELNSLVVYLKKLDIGLHYREIAYGLRNLLKIDGDDLLLTLLSFTDLLKVEDDDIGIISKNLAESYNELSKVGLNTKAKNKLKGNLLQVLSNYKNLLLLDKVGEYRNENYNSFIDSSFHADIRFLEFDKLEENEKYGVILHKFRVKYLASNSKKELYMHLSIDDMIKLKGDIEEAIERDKMLRGNFSGDIKLI